ncbi:hypothetical protein ACEK06_14340 [Pseudomonas brenneri]|uniref:hypothetical protein n=1 Tax=Pseudomonas brenneri TaxID=129817 RepID=UPI00357096AC
MFNLEESKAMKVSSLTPPDLYPSTRRSMPLATGLAQGASGPNEAGQPKAISSVTASTGSQDTAAGQPKSSAIWVNYQHGVNLAEAIEPGSSKRMTRAELIAYPGKKSAESVTGEQELLIASTRVAPTLDWAVASGILVEKTSYTQAEIQTAISALDQHMEDMAKAATSLTTPVPMRKDYFTGTQWVSPIKGHDDPDNKKYSVALYDDQKFGDDFKADLVSKKSAYGMLIKQLISTLPVEDRIAIEHGKVGLYALKPPGTGDDLERDSFLIKAFHDGKTTVYEVNPGLGTARRRDDFKGVFTGASAVGKKQLPDGTDAKDFTVWGKPSIQGKQYQPKADQKQGVQPDNTPFNSKIYTLDSLSEFPASSAGTAEPLAPNTLSSERSNNIGNILSEKLFYIKDLDLLHMAVADPGRVTQEEKDDRANYQKFREERESRRDFLKGFVPFWQGIEAIVAGRPIEGIGKILIDILSFMLPVGKVASTALKEGAQIIKSTLPQFSKFAKRMLGFTRNPGVPGVKWEGGIQGLKWTEKVSGKIAKGGEQFRANAASLPRVGSQMREIEFAGSKYFVAGKPDAGDGVHYLLRVPAPEDPSKLVSSSIVAKPDAAGVWSRRGIAGGGPGSSKMLPVEPQNAGSSAETFIENLLQQRNAMPGSKPRVRSVADIKEADFSVPPRIYRAHTAFGDSASTGLRRAAGTTTSGDDYLAAIIKHTARQGGSGGEVMSFSASSGKANSFARQYSKNNNPIPVFVVDTTKDPAAFRTVSDIILKDGERLVVQGKVTRATLLQAADQLANQELEVFYVKGDVPAAFIVT